MEAAISDAVSRGVQAAVPDRPELPEEAGGRLQNRAIGGVATLLHYLGAAILAVMCMIICADAISRLVFNAPFPGTSELVASLLVTVTCLQLPYALVKNALLRATFLLDLVSLRARRLLDTLAYAVGFAFFGAISVASIRPLAQSLETMEYAGTLDSRFRSGQ